MPLLISKDDAHNNLAVTFLVQVFGIQLSDQELGSDGIPHLVAKCLQFVEITGK